MTVLQSWLDTLSQLAIGVGVLYGLWRMLIITREARAGRERAIAASVRAAEAANATAASVAKMGGDLEELKVHTNSIKDALVLAEKGKSRLEGKEEQRAETEAKA